MITTKPANENPNKPNNWLDALGEIRQQDKTQREKQAKADDLDLSVIGKQNQATRLLSICDAHKLLRRVQTILLGGKGMIEVFDRSSDYEQAIALVWQGSVSQARIPNPQDPEPYQYIMVGATSRKVYVNGRALEFVTPEALKEGLVWAAKNPLQSTPQQNKVGKTKK
jgi:hypothetical protein